MATATFLQTRRPDGAARTALGMAVGAAGTLLLFTALSRLERTLPARAVEDDAVIERVALPVEPPPPPPAPEVKPVAAEPVPVDTGFEAAGDVTSPVRIAVPVPDLAGLIAPPVLAPPAHIQSLTLATDFRPRVDLNIEMAQHVYQEAEVDKRPHVLVTSNPFIPYRVRRGADVLRVILLLVIEPSGTAKDIRILESSGNADFDNIIVKCVRDDWTFEPAVRKGRVVRCLVRQPFTVRWSTTPFEN